MGSRSKVFIGSGGRRNGILRRFKPGTRDTQPGAAARSPVPSAWSRQRWASLSHTAVRGWGPAAKKTAAEPAQPRRWAWLGRLRGTSRDLPGVAGVRRSPPARGRDYHRDAPERRRQLGPISPALAAPREGDRKAGFAAYFPSVQVTNMELSITSGEYQTELMFTPSGTSNGTQPDACSPGCRSIAGVAGYWSATPLWVILVITWDGFLSVSERR